MNPQYMSTPYGYGGQEPQNYVPPPGPGRGFPPATSGPVATPSGPVNYYNGPSLQQRPVAPGSYTATQGPPGKQNPPNQYGLPPLSQNGPRMGGPLPAGAMIRPPMGQAPPSMDSHPRAPRPPTTGQYPGQPNPPRPQMSMPPNLGQTQQLTNHMSGMTISQELPKSQVPMSGPPVGAPGMAPSMSHPLRPPSIPGPNPTMQGQQYPPSTMPSIPPPGGHYGMDPASISSGPYPQENINSGMLPGPPQPNQYGQSTHQESQFGPVGGPPGGAFNDMVSSLPSQPYNQFTSGPLPTTQPNQLSYQGHPTLQGQPPYQDQQLHQGQQPLQGPPPSQYGQQMYSMGAASQPPPSPGLGPQSMSMHGGMGPAPMPLQQPRRLDPDQMPSPLLDTSFSCTQIQVIEDDKKNRSGYFVTNTKGQVPPLVTTDFYTHDQGICNPRFIRSTMYCVPNTPDMMKQAGVPFAITINPFARLHPKEEQPPIVNLGEMGPVRCLRCKVYMCPFMQFVDGGRRFQCVFCKASTEVPAEYFAHLDHTGRRVDLFERPELYLGSYEFVATKEYCKNNIFPNPPAFIFMLDVSYNSVKNGMVHLLCQNMKELLQHLPVEGNVSESAIKVGFVTYNNSVHFFNVKGTLTQPQMMVVSDVEDMFMPLLDGFLVSVSEADAVIDSLMEQIPLMFGETRETEIILGPVIQAGLEALKAANRAGKLFIFHSSLPIFEAPGRLKNRDDRKLLGTEKEKTILSPQIPFYTKLAQDCVAVACSVDLFLFPNAYIDMATIGQVCSITGGQIFKYTYFQAEVDGHRFLEDLKRDINRPIAFDAIMRVRTSTGIRPVDFVGNLYMSNTTDVELASVDSDKSVSVEIKHDDKLTEEDGAYIQAAILYTSVGGQRRLRVHNLSLSTCNQMADLYRSCELDTIINWLSKISVRGLLQHSPKIIRDNLINLCAQILACYRKNCASPSSAGQLILPECMKLLPLYINCVLKNDALVGGQEMTLDDRSWLMQTLMPMDVSASVCFFYPRLLPLHEVDPNGTDFSSSIRCSAERLRDNGVYLLENGLSLYLWVGLNVSQEWLLNVFSVQSAAQIDIDKDILLELDNPLSQKIREIIKKIQEERHKYLKLIIVRQRDKLDPWFRHFLVEDKGANGSSSYVDFLCHMHKEIRNQLS